MARGFFVDGLWGTLTLLWDIATLPVKLYDFGKHVFQVLGEVDLGAGMQKIGSLMLDAGKYLSGNGISLIEKLVENAKVSKVDDVADTFSNLYGTAKEKATELGGSVADIFVKFFSQKPEKVGETLGDTAGSLAFDALLGVVTAGAAAAAKRGLTAARSFVQPLLNLLIRTGQKAKMAVQGVWSYAKRITASARTGILTWVKKVSAELGAKTHAIVESIESIVERLLTRANKGKKAEAELSSELAEQKAVQLLSAIAEAKAITAAYEKIGAATPLLLAALNVLKKRFRWIKGFRAVPKPVVGHYRIDMLASEHVDAVYDPKKEERAGAREAVLQEFGETIESLSEKANRVINKEGLTRAGQALDKHAQGQRLSGTFPKLSGGIKERNKQASKIVSELLENPESQYKRLGRGGMEVRAPDGRGLRFDSDGRSQDFWIKGDRVMAIKLQSGFEILRFSDLKYDRMTVEIQFNGEQIAQINIDKGLGYEDIELFTEFLNKGFTPIFSLSDFLEALEKARVLLREQIQ